MRAYSPLPVEALGDGFDHQFAFGEAREVKLVVAGFDRQGIAAGQRRRLERFQAIQGAHHDAVWRPFARGKVEKQDRHPGVGQMRGDLRPHDAGAEYRRPTHFEPVHEAVHDASRFPVAGPAKPVSGRTPGTNGSIIGAGGARSIALPTRRSGAFHTGAAPVVAQKRNAPHGAGRRHTGGAVCA